MKLARMISAPVIRRAPIETLPSLLARIYGINVPKNVVPNLAPSPSGPANINIILRLLNETVRVAGDIAECGVFRGATFIPMALYVKQHQLAKTVFAFDSFEGFDSSVMIDLELGGQDLHDKRVGGFGETSYETLCEKISCLGLEPHVEVVKGYFNNTLSSHRDRSFSFVHLDCDLFESYRDCLQFFYPRMSRGGIILLDEYNDPPWPGCNKAVDEFLGLCPDKLLEIGSDNYRKWYLRKH